MEFFKTISKTGLDENRLKDNLTIKNLPKLCASIDSVIMDNGSNGVIYCIWGQFEINVEELKYGVRFSLPNCPNALAWSVTIDADNDVVIYCTINKQEHDEDFIETIHQFMDDWQIGLNHVCRKKVTCAS